MLVFLWLIKAARLLKLCLLKEALFDGKKLSSHCTQLSLVLRSLIEVISKLYPFFRRYIRTNRITLSALSHHLRTLCFLPLSHELIQLFQQIVNLVICLINRFANCNATLCSLEVMLSRREKFTMGELLSQITMRFTKCQVKRVVLQLVFKLTLLLI